MITILTTIINFIKSIYRILKRNRAIKLVYQLYTFIGTFAIIRMFIRSFKVIRVLFSAFSSILLVFLTDFNINSLFTVISTVLSYTPDLFTGFFTNTYNIISKLWPFSDQTGLKYSQVETITTTKQVIKDAILDKSHRTSGEAPETFFSLRKYYADEPIHEDKWFI